jgi:hypothetical protein
VAWKGADVGEEESAIKKTKKCMCVNCYAYVLVVNHGEHLKIPIFSSYFGTYFPYFPYFICSDPIDSVRRCLMSISLGNISNTWQRRRLTLI